MNFFLKGKLLILVLILISTLLLVSCGPRTEPITPGRLVGFQPDGYRSTAAEVVLGGKIDGMEAKDAVILNMEFLRADESIKMSVAQFDGLIDATSFWYGWTREVAGPVRSAFSAFPMIYGELSGNYEDGYVTAWFRGKWLYLFRGEKAFSEELAELFKDYKEAVEKSVGL